MSPEKILKTKPHGYGPHDLRRCQSVENRLVNERSSGRAHVHMVQCSLARHGDEIEHEWRGRKFGTPMRRGNDRPYKRRPRKVPWRIRRIHDNRWRAEQGLPPIEQTSVGRA